MVHTTTYLFTTTLDLWSEDPTAYRNILEINGAQFDKLLHIVSNMLKKQNTVMKEGESGSCKS